MKNIIFINRAILCLVIGLLFSSLSFGSEVFGPFLARIDQINRVQTTIITLNGQKFQVQRNLHVKGPQDVKVSNLKVGDKVGYTYVASRRKGILPQLRSLSLILE